MLELREAGKTMEVCNCCDTDHSYDPIGHIL